MAVARTAEGFAQKTSEGCLDTKILLAIIWKSTFFGWEMEFGLFKQPEFSTMSTSTSYLTHNQANRRGSIGKPVDSNRTKRLKASKNGWVEIFEPTIDLCRLTQIPFITNCIPWNKSRLSFDRINLNGLESGHCHELGFSVGWPFGLFRSRDLLSKPGMIGPKRKTAHISLFHMINVINSTMNVWIFHVSVFVSFPVSITKTFAWCSYIFFPP